MSSSLPWDRPRRVRSWFAGRIGARGLKIIALVLLVCFVAAGVAGYALHRHFKEKAAGYNLDELGQMESASTIYDRRKQVFGHIYLQNREPIPLSQMPADLQNAVICAEDARFYSHSGSDFRGIIRAALKNFRASRVRQGASTITQQLARNSLALGGKTFSRKILEIYVSRRIEATLTKEQILEYYLNRIYLGSGLYGVEAASKGYFGKPAKDLTLGEAATLAGMIKSPTYLSPWNNKARATEQRDFVLGRMVEEGKISRAQADNAIAETLAVRPRTFASSDSYAVEAIRQQVVAQVGADEAVSGGYRIYTTLDADLQRTAETAMRTRLDEIERLPAFQAANHPTYAQYQSLYKDEEKKVANVAAQNPKAQAPNVHANLPDPAYLQGALLAVNNSDGGVVAVVGGRDFKHSEYNRALSSTAKRPFGTAFTPLVYAAAYQKGISPATLFLDQVIDNRQVMIGGQTGILGEWGVERVDNKFDGPMPASVALIRGKNSATVRVGNEVGLDNVLALTKRAGIASEMRQFPATFLGSSEMTLSELALAYTTFPNGGWRPAAPYIVTKIEDSDGNVVFQYKPSGAARVRVVDEVPAYQVHNDLAESLRWGTGEAATQKLGLRLPPGSAGGKTGTAYNFTDAVFCGYDQEITCAVWTGFDAPRTSIFRGAFGNDLAMPIWVQVMNAASALHPAHDLPKPSAIKMVELCMRSGELATDNCFEIDPATGKRHRVTYMEALTASQTPRNKCGVHDGSGNPRVLALSTFSGRVNVRGGGGNAAGGQQVRKATAAVDLSQFQPVAVQGTSVLGDSSDPYGTTVTTNSAASHGGTSLAAANTNNPAAAAASPSPGGETVARPPAPQATPEPQVRRAGVVSPYEQEAANRPVQIEKPAPLEFN